MYDIIASQCDYSFKLTKDSVIIFLPIKKIFYDQILSGVKKFEYREDKHFYQNKFNKDVNTIIFHYYKNPKIKVKIISVKKIKTPKKCTVIKTEKCYRIKLGTVTEI